MTDSERMTDVLGIIVQMNDPKCLDTIRHAAYDRMHEQKVAQAQVATALWKVGDKVQMSPEHRNRKPHGAVGTIQKINKVKMKVDFGNFQIWNVPKAMLVTAD